MKKDRVSKRVAERLLSDLPSFEDIFDEETFYIFFACLVVLSIIGAVIASRFVTLRDWTDDPHSD